MLVVNVVVIVVILLLVSFVVIEMLFSGKMSFACSEVLKFGEEHKICIRNVFLGMNNGTPTVLIEYYNSKGELHKIVADRDNISSDSMPALMSLEDGDIVILCVNEFNSVLSRYEIQVEKVG